MPPEPADADTAEFRFDPASSSTPERLRVDVAARTHPGRVRDQNEDAYTVFRLGRSLDRLASSLPESELPPTSGETAYVMIVADGVGGHEGGEIASRTAMLTTMRFIVDAPKWTMKLDDPETREADLADVRQQSERYIATVHDELRKLAAQHPHLAGMGTTLTCAYLTGTDLFVLHVGDSKAYLVRAGALRRVTRDHTVAQEYADCGLIGQDEVAKHRMQHVLTKAVGGPEERLEGDIYHMRVASGDRLLLCSDGLTDMVTEDEIAGVLAQHDATETACRALETLALERGGRDNITVIVANLRSR
jgi:serine/threonine protein phosphatase PrpC